MWHKTEGQGDDHQAKPDPPRPQPKVVIDEGGKDAGHQAHPEPERLAFNEKVNVVVTITRERARAEKHNDADYQHAEHSEKQDVSALAVHRGMRLLLGLLRLWFRHEQFLSNLKFARIINMIQRE